jgi:dipeptidyl aminopeptidase/acylaminoacyl peptidase
MRDFRLDPEDVENIALAYRWLVEQPLIDPSKSGLLGTCVGGSFALMAAASPLVRDHVAFVSAYALYSSMWTLARDIASETRFSGALPEQWHVDPLTRQVYVHSMTALLEPSEAERLIRELAESAGHVEGIALSPEAKRLQPLLMKMSPDGAEAALKRLPAAMQERLTALSPVNFLNEIRAPLIVFFHDQGDPVIPVAESRRLRSALAARKGVHYTEFTVFQHLDPMRGKPRLLPLLKELARMYLAIYPLFRQAVG